MTAAEYSEVYALPQSWSKAEVVDALRINPRKLDKLCADGKVGFYKPGRERRFFAEHIGQIRELLEVKPKPVYSDNLTRLGITAASARRRTTARGQS